MKMRLPCQFMLPMIAALAIGTPIPADSPRVPVTVTGIRMGWPINSDLLMPGVPDSLHRLGFWTPVYVSLSCQVDRDAGWAELVVAASDGDDVPAKFAVPLPQMRAGEEKTIIAYARPGSNHNIDVSVVPTGGSAVVKSESTRALGMDPSQMLFLSIGAPPRNVQWPGTPKSDAEADDNSAMSARALVASVTRVQQMPTEWFGYAGVDLIVLTTGDPQFVQELIHEADGRKAALAEWVRRGGRLIVSAGQNAALLNEFGELANVLPIQPIRPVELEVPRITWLDQAATTEGLGRLTVAECQERDGRPATTLVPGATNAAGQVRPLVCRASCGMGKVTLVAFDLEVDPDERQAARQTFFADLVIRSGTRFSQDVMKARATSVVEDSQLDNLVKQLDTFPGIPVVSFGWIALLILGFVVLVGPLDYWFLKKQLKRLEFTWLTYPLIVLAVSASAYATVYTLKSRELRINKFDLVDIEVGKGHVFGHTWFTLYSPKMRNYPVGVAPTPAWGEDGRRAVVGWAGLPRPNRQSFFRRAYAYLPHAHGLVDVPLQTWSTKCFQSEWVAQSPEGRSLVEFTDMAYLKRSDSKRDLNGFIVHHLPAPIENAALIYSAGEREPMVKLLGTLLPGRVDSAGVEINKKAVSAVPSRPFSSWLSRSNPSVREGTGPSVPAWLPVQAMFQDLLYNSNLPSNNASLRGLDQSWRVQPGGEPVAILVGTLPRLDGPTESVSADPVSPSRLHLGEAASLFPGVIRQETVVRIFIPIR